MEIVGFILFLIGAASLDSTGTAYYVAIGLTIIGLVTMYCGDRIKTERKRRHERRRSI